MARFPPVWLCLLVLLPFAAPALRAQPAVPADVCDQAAAVAERQYALPAGILAAIGRVESGRFDPANQALRPWPWSINAAGAGSMPPTRLDAIAQVRSLQARGMQNIDVGCFQVNLLHHPDAFATLQAAFDPLANARYAGRFLATLHRQAGSWNAAIMAYHSAWPARGTAYRDKVLAVWRTGQSGQTGWTASLATDAPDGVVICTPHPRGTAPTVIRLSQSKLNTPIIITPNS